MINEGIRYGLLVYNKTSADTVSVSAPSFSWGYEGRIVIPSEIYSYSDKVYKVTGIKPRGFNTTLLATGLTIPGSIVEVSESAFASCVSLKDVTIEEGVQIIRPKAFCRCKGLKNIYIPASITTIDEKAFDECLSLEMITVNEDNISFCSLDGSLYKKDLTELVLCAPAKRGCLRIPSAVRKIRPTALEWTLCLEDIKVDDDNQNFCSIDGLLYNKEVTRLIYCPQSRERDVVIADGVTTVCQGAFCLCEKIKNITIPDTLTDIETEAFSECAQLRSIVIPSKVKAIGEGAFYSCSMLAGITLKAKVPPLCADYTFDSHSYKSTTLYIPRGTKAEYISAPVWKNFKDIVEVDMFAKEPVIEDVTISVNLMEGKVTVRGMTCEVDVGTPEGINLYKLSIDGGSSEIHLLDNHVCKIKAGNRTITIAT